MRFSRVIALAFLWLATAALRAQTLPVEYATFMSHGKPVSCVVYDAHDATATIVFLRGASASDLAFARAEARFFAEHAFRVLLVDYLAVTPNLEPTATNYRRWGQAVEDIVSDLHARPPARARKIALIGQGLGASVALLAGSRKLGVEAIAEWSGLLPNQFFSQVQNLPPLLILHGAQDKQVPIVNARQLVRLCELKDFTCEAGLYPDEGHIFSTKATDAANQRVLTFFRTYLWASLPTKAE
jgi:dipeptidyl aminopeptidase/acylaminoacyl peptidase